MTASLRILALLCAVALAAACGGQTATVEPEPTPTPAPTPTPNGGDADLTPTPPPANTPTPTAVPPASTGWRTDGPFGGQVGNVAPNQTLTLASGAAASLEEIAAGRPLVLYFFEEW